MKRLLVLVFIFTHWIGWSQVRYSINDVADVKIYGTWACYEIGRYPIGSGDYNGDGIDDFIIGTDETCCIECKNYAHVVMSGTDLPQEVDLQESWWGTSDRQSIVGGFLSAGARCASLGDFNGDGYDDMLFGDSGATIDGVSAVGQAYIKYGKPSIPNRFDLEDATMEGVHIIGSRFYGQMCATYALRGVGDINNDGFDDVALGAPSYASSEPYCEAFIIYGGTDVPGELRTHELGSRGVWIQATQPKDTFGCAMDGVGDVNGDGFNDVVIGSTGVYGTQGYVCLIFGGMDFPERLWTESLGKRGVRIEGADVDDAFGTGVSAAGDVNGDGYADFLVGAQNIERVYLFFGGPSWPEYLDADNMGSRGVIIRGDENIDALGLSVSGAGDVDGDGYDDIMMTAWDLRIAGSSQISIVLGGENLTGRLRGVLDEYDQIVLEKADGKRRAYGYSSIQLGDVNGDGLRDLAIGEAFGNPYGREAAGRIHVVYGGHFWSETPTQTETSTPTSTPTPTPSETPEPPPTQTPTPGGYHGWILTGDGAVHTNENVKPITDD